MSSFLPGFAFSVPHWCVLELPRLIHYASCVPLGVPVLVRTEIPVTDTTEKPTNAHQKPQKVQKGLTFAVPNRWLGIFSGSAVVLAEYLRWLFHSPPVLR